MISGNLFNELKEVDKVLYDEILSDVGLTYDENGNEMLVTFDDLNEAATKAWLQACLQDAIRAREWYYNIRNKSKTEVECIIWRGGDGFINPDFMHIGEGSTEDEALLQAYLQAANSI